ncbi:uncharacterized protein LOC108675658 [Hyalella azteca]|uniref:Uncharacterized protein LOC108675658 n=1 Tax=Hyalella azteca TaxID=294128 RepID=A0A8B7NZB8_HYAAZ|nr:uncharacterized protein LOC108675658 [Hyalella azteca]
MNSSQVVQIVDEQVMLEFDEPIVEAINVLTSETLDGKSQMPHEYGAVQSFQVTSSRACNDGPTAVNSHDDNYYQQPDIANSSQDDRSKSAMQTILHKKQEDMCEIRMDKVQFIEDTQNDVFLESCIDSVWTEEVLLKFISLHSDKFRWQDSSNHPLLYEELKNELELDDSIMWRELEHKWKQLNQIYAILAAKTDISSLEARKSALFVQLQAAESSEISSCISENNSVNSETKMCSIVRHKRKSPEFTWSLDITRRFIQMRTNKHSEIPIKGHTAVYQEVLRDLGIDDRVTVMMARKKWNYLVNRYQDEYAAGGERSWALMNDMAVVMNTFAGLDTSKLKSRASPEFLWPNELTEKFIELRVSKKQDFLKYGVQHTYSAILKELGIARILTPTHLRKKWNYLVAKHKEISSYCTDGSHGWAFYDSMTNALDALAQCWEPERILHTSPSHQPEQIWTRPVVIKFIQLRAAYCKETKNCSAMYSSILSELGLSSTFKPHQARKKWNYLWNKYQELNEVGVSGYLRQAWPYFTVMKSIAHLIPESKNSVTYETPQDDPGKEAVSEVQRSEVKPTRIYRCFLCSVNGTNVADYFFFENDQRLLHTQNTVLQLLEQLVGHKLINFESTTMLCSRCTTLVNEGDAVLHRHDKIKQELRGLYQTSRNNATRDDSCNIVMGNDPSSPTLEVEADSVISVEEDASGDIVMKQEPPDVASSRISYSKRGRKRKATVFTEAIQTCMKLEPNDDAYDPNSDLNYCYDDQYFEPKPKKKFISARSKGRGRGRRGRGRGRDRPLVRSTLIGRGLDGQYSNSNKQNTSSCRGPKIFNCSECREEFKKYSDLISHRKEKHTVVDNTPLEVEETVLDTGLITYFNKDKANSLGTSHPCKDCDKIFLRKDDLSYHHELYHTNGKGRSKSAFKDKSYVCEECGDTFLFKYRLKLHINSKHLNDAGEAANDFTCGDCGTKLGSLPGLTFHMRKHHNKVLNYKKSAEFLCSDCGFMATSAKKLKDHQEAQCGYAAKEQVQCETCGKTVLKVSLKMHKIKMHSDFKEQCDRCGEKYATKTDLLRHVNVVHLNILLYACKQCNEKFPTSDALRYHRVKMHEKPAFFCHICNKSYKRVGELNTHVKRVHNDRRKAEVCSYCGKEYYDRSGLRNHLVSKHSVPPEFTYSDNYLRKKRFEGLPLAKIFERRDGMDEVSNNLSLGCPQQELRVSEEQQGSDHGDSDLHKEALIQESPVAVERSLASYSDINGQEEESSMVVTEITENSGSEHQQIILDSHGNIIHQDLHHQHHHHHHHYHHHHQHNLMHSNSCEDECAVHVVHQLPNNQQVPHQYHHQQPGLNLQPQRTIIGLDVMYQVAEDQNVKTAHVGL